MWHSPKHPLRRAHVYVTTSVVAALLITLIALPSGLALATSAVDRWQGRLAADVKTLAELEQEQASLKAKIFEAESTYANEQSQFEDRAVSIYKSGGIRGAGTVAVVADATTVDEGLQRAEVARQVADHDERELKRVERIAARIPSLERRLNTVQLQIVATRSAIARDKKRIIRAKRDARLARKRAAAMARTIKAPLQPSVVIAETTEAAVASQSTSDTSAKSSTSGSGGSAPGLRQSGVASMYGNEFAGRPTASGEPYDPGGMTAAHPTLPMGTLVSVSGPGGAVMVRINDRGPFVGGRIIDLSQAAAAAVGLNGLASVTITVQS